MKRKRSTRKRKPIRPTPGKRVSVSKILLIIGILLLGIWGTHKILYLRSLRLTSSLLNTFNASQGSKAQITQIRVSSRIRLPVIAAGYVNGRWLISKDKANHVSLSARPGEPGNIILYAHNTRNTFGPLLWVSPGEEITLSTSDGKEHRYTIARIREVDPKNVELLRPTPIELLTLYTCSGFLDSKRWVVQAIPTVLQ